MSDIAIKVNDFSQHQEPKDGLLKALVKGVVSLYRGYKNAMPTFIEENPNDLIGVEAIVPYGRLNFTYSPSQTDPQLTPSALRDFYEQPEVSFGVTAGRTKYVPLAKRRAAAERRKIGETVRYAFYKRHYK
jgi:hypothetical protein